MPTNMFSGTRVDGLSFLDNGTVSQTLGGPAGVDLYAHVTSVIVFINGLTHQFADDLDFLLVGPSGANLEFWSDAGGTQVISNVDYTISDNGFNLLPDGSLIAAGTYRPTDYGTPVETSSNWGLPPSLVINHPVVSGTGTLGSTFTGTFVAGIWTLYVRDDASGDLGSLTSWGVQVSYRYIPRPDDFGFDHRSGILWRDTGGGVSTWDMSGHTVTAGHSLGAVPTSFSIAGTGDFDDDGKADLLWRDASGAVALWEMNSSSAIKQTFNLGAVPTNWNVAGIGDFNFDGHSDVLWRTTSGHVAIWDMNGPTIAAGHDIGDIPTSFHIVGIGDFDNDGKSDILWRHNGGDLAMWLMKDGGTVKASPDLGVIGLDWHVLGIGDFNGDGASDILWRHDSGAIAMWLMNGPAVISNPTVGALPLSWELATIGNFNPINDTRSDIVWQEAGGTVAMWEMNGGTITTGTSLGVVPKNFDIVSNHYEFV
jgi:hypothetical protein